MTLQLEQYLEANDMETKMTKTISYRLLTISMLLLVGCFALVSAAHAVNPAPDGGYPNDNTAEGDDALFTLTTGSENTAIGLDALYSTTIGGSNTAVGKSALDQNTTGSF